MSAANGTYHPPSGSQIRCPHGRVMFSDQTVDGVRRVHGGIPSCCFDMLCTPAAGETFVLLDRSGRQKRIHDGLLAARSLVLRTPGLCLGAVAT